MLPDLFSRRKRLAAKTGPDVYQYVDISPKLRQQTLFSFERIVKASRQGNAYGEWDVFELVVHMMREELGQHRLTKYERRSFDELSEWFLSEREVVHLLDAVELVCRISANVGRNKGHLKEVDGAIATLNERFLEAQFGYQYVDGEIVEITDQFAHAEIILPALTLLNDGRFATANEEFRKAHQEFRAGEFADCVTDCGKALESVLKVIAAERDWSGVTASSNLSQLIDAAVKNDLFPSYMEDQITGLRKMLQGAGTVRNKDGAHGKGEQQALDDRDLAAYQLHQTAAAIIFLAQR